MHQRLVLRLSIISAVVGVTIVDHHLHDKYLRSKGVIFSFRKNFSIVRTRKARQSPAYALYHRTVRRWVAKPVVSPGVNRVRLFVRPSRTVVDLTFRGSRKLANGHVPIIRCFSITGGCWLVYRVVRRSQDVTEIIVLPARIPF